MRDPTCDSGNDEAIIEGCSTCLCVRYLTTRPKFSPECARVEPRRRIPISAQFRWIPTICAPEPHAPVDKGKQRTAPLGPSERTPLLSSGSLIRFTHRIHIFLLQDNPPPGPLQEVAHRLFGYTRRMCYCLGPDSAVSPQLPLSSVEPYHSGHTRLRIVHRGAGPHRPLECNEGQPRSNFGKASVDGVSAKSEGALLNTLRSP